jgi:hypothetical protein
VEKRIATAAPAFCLLLRLQLLWLAEQAACAAKLRTPSLVMGHDLKLSTDAATELSDSHEPAFATARRRQTRRSTSLRLQHRAKMRLVGHLCNPSSSLERVLDALPGAPLEVVAGSCSPPVPAPRRLGNGVVQRAVVKVLTVADAPMRRAGIHAAVERQLGQSVSKESVSWCLCSGSRGSEPRFERVAYGFYRLTQP